jgi:hypothetical protein
MGLSEQSLNALDQHIKHPKVKIFEVAHELANSTPTHN